MSIVPIIAVVGAPRTGKSYLAKKLAQHYGAELFLEDDGGGYPDRMQENLAKNIRPLERQLWFRTKCVEKYLKAKELQSIGKSSVLDIFWLSTHLYIDDLLEGFERELMWDISGQDAKTLGYPDVIVYLRHSLDGIKEFVAQGGREFDISDKYYREVIEPAHRSHELFFGKPQDGMNVLSLDRTGIDFNNDEHLLELVSRINTSLVV